jgi:hypothetical protein
MAEEPIGEWCDPSLALSYEGGLSSSSSDDDESTSYEEEVVTPRPQKKRCTEEEEDPTYTLEKAEEEDPTYMPEKTGPSTRASRSLGRHIADERTA